QIFEEFRRLAPPTERAARESKGLGLGLAIVDRLSQVLHHPVQVRSWPGQGSVFSVFVAYGTPHEKHPTDAQEPPLSTANRTERLRSPGSLNGLRVLSIDNDPSILEGMVALLTHWGCDVIAASHGGEALRALAGTAPDIVLADYQLDDDENGLDTLDWLRRQFPATTPFPAILITGLTTPEVKADALARGYQVLYKPVKPAALRAMMNTLVR
ncbi:MAG: response regulator, partial [Gammaproteobacteria bacterium]|nr:response regulator [Gammaproteobacteria bacterium]